MLIINDIYPIVKQLDQMPSINFSSRIWRNGMMEYFILPYGAEKSRLSVVVTFSITTIVGTFLSRRLWDINSMLGIRWPFCLHNFFCP